MKIKITKILVVLTVICIICTCFAGCKKEVKTEDMIVSATITSVEHKGMWMQPLRVGKVTTMVTHPEKNIVHLQYNELTLEVDSKSLYNECKDRIGDNIDVTLRCTTYDDGSEYKRLIYVK